MTDHPDVTAARERAALPELLADLHEAHGFMQWTDADALRMAIDAYGKPSERWPEPVLLFVHESGLIAFCPCGAVVIVEDGCERCSEDDFGSAMPFGIREAAE